MVADKVQWKILVMDGRMDRKTEGRTDRAKPVYPLFFEWGYKYPHLIALLVDLMFPLSLTSCGKMTSLWGPSNSPSLSDDVYPALERSYKQYSVIRGLKTSSHTSPGFYVSAEQVS